MTILNLGCGSKTSPSPSVVNIDWSIMLRIRSNPVFRKFAPILLKADRLSRFEQLSTNIMVHDLSRGIPFLTASVDVVYHSHVLEHLDRNISQTFIRECARVLRPGGLIRVVVPDFEYYCRKYLNHCELCYKNESDNIRDHDSHLEPLLLQSVRREADGSSRQFPLRRYVENLLLGDARKRGETHQWMYDRFNLGFLLSTCGFKHPCVRKFDESAINNWQSFGLDMDVLGMEYKANSMYMEATR